MPVNISGGDLSWDATINDSIFEAQLNRIEQQLNSFASNVEKQGNQLDDLFKRAAQAAASYFSLQAGENLIRQLVEVRGEYQQLEVAFTTILKSKEKANELMSQVVQLAASTPFTLTEVATGAKQLLAYGTQAKDVTSTLTMLGNVAAGVSAPIGDIVYLYGTLQTQGRAYAKDIEQFTGRGIPIIAELAKQFGVTKDQVQNLVSEGKVGFPEVQKAFQSMTGTGGIFFNLMQEQSKTLTGQLSNLKDAFDNVLNQIGKSNEGLLSGGIAELTELVKNYQTVLNILEGLVIVYGTYRTALIATNAVMALQKIGAEALTAAELLQYSALELLTQAQTKLNGSMATTVTTAGAITAAIAILLFSIRSITAENEHLHTAETQLNDIRAKASDAIIDEKQKIQDQIGVIKSHNSTQAERAGALKKIIDLNPDLLSGLNAQNVTTQQGTEIINKYIGSLNDKLVAEAAYQQKLDNLKKANDIRTKGYGALDYTQIAGAIFDDIGSGNLFDSNHQQRVVENYAKVYEDANKKIDDAYKKQLESRAKNDQTDTNNQTVKAAHDKAYYDKIVKDATDALHALDQLDPQFKTKRAALIDQINKAQAQSDLFNPKTDQKNTNDYNNALQKRADLMQKIHEFNEKANAVSLDPEKQKVADVKKQYDDFIAEIEKYNKDPKTIKLKTQISQGVINNLKGSEQTAVDDQTDRNATDAIAKELQVRKTLYAQYEADRKNLGDDTANKEHADLLVTGKSYKEYLQGLLDLTNQNNDNLSAGPLAERKQILVKAIQDATDTEKKANADLLVSTLSYYDKRTALDDDYNKNRKKLVAAGLFSNVDELDQQHKQEIEALEAAQANKIAILQHYNDNVIELTRKQAKNYIKTLQEILAGSPDLTDAQKSIINQNIGKLQNALKDNNGLSKQYTLDLENQKKQLEEQLKVLTPYSDKWKEIYEKIASINLLLGNQSQNTTQKAFDTIAKDAQATSQGFQQLASSLADINPGLSDTLSSLGEIAGVVGNIASTASSAMSGDIVGAITGVMSVASGLISFFNRGKASAIQAAAEIKKYEDGLLTSAVSYNELLRDRIRSQQDINTLTSQELKDREQMLALQTQQAQADYNALLAKIQASGVQITGEHTEKYGGIFGIGQKTKVVQDTAGVSGADYDTLLKLYTEGKLDDTTKAWFEELQKVHDEMSTISDDAAATADQLNKIATGTTADDLANAILDGFKQGKRSAADFADDFQSLMQNALLSSFETNYLSSKIADFYQAFADAANSDGGLTDDKIAKLKDQYAQVINDAGQKLTDIEKITGTSLSTSNATNSVQGSIQASLTEETGTVLAGVFRGVQLNTIQLVSLSQQQITIMNQESVAKAQRHADFLADSQRKIELLTSIDNNTSKTASNTDMLKDIKSSLASIDKKVGSTNATLAANGMI